MLCLIESSVAHDGEWYAVRVAWYRELDYRLRATTRTEAGGLEVEGYQRGGKREHTIRTCATLERMDNCPIPGITAIGI